MSVIQLLIPVIIASLIWLLYSSAQQQQQHVNNDVDEKIVYRILQVEHKLDELINVIQKVVRHEEATEEVISKTQDKIDGLTSLMNELRTDVTEVKADIRELKAGTSVLQTDVHQLKSNTTEVREDVSQLKSNIHQVDSIAQQVSTKVNGVDDKLNVVKINVVELLSKPRLFPGWLYKGRGHPNDFHSHVGEGHLSLEGCVRLCEAKRTISSSWNSLAWNVGTRYCMCYQYGRGHNNSPVDYVHFQTVYNAH